MAVRKGRIPHCAMRLPQSRRGGAPPRIGAWRRRRYETSMRTVSSGAGSHARPVRTALPRRMPEAVPAMFRHDVGSVGERRAHTPQVAGSTPARRRLDSSVGQSIGLINRVSRVRLPLQATPGRKSLTRKHPARCSAGARPPPRAPGTAQRSRHRTIALEARGRLSAASTAMHRDRCRRTSPPRRQRAGSVVAAPGVFPLLPCGPAMGPATGRAREPIRRARPRPSRTDRITRANKEKNPCSGPRGS